MSKPHISEELKRFIKDEIRTVLRLEILLLLHHQQAKLFSAAEISRELGVQTEATQEQLTALEGIGLAIKSPCEASEYKYHPANTTLASKVDQLAVAYATQRVPILSVILADNSDRTRLFAEAFRIITRND